MDPDNREAVLGVQEVEGMLQEGDYEVEDHSMEGGGAVGGGYDEEEENKMEDSEEILVLGSRESLEGVREVWHCSDMVSSIFHFYTFMYV